MTATINAKKDRPNYFVIIRYKDDTGKERTKTISTEISVKGNNKRKAERLKDEILEQYKRDKVSIEKDPFFTDFFKECMETWLITSKIQLTTYDSYTITMNAHILPFFEPLKLRVKDVEPNHIQKYVNKKLKRVSANTVKKHIANISSCLESAVRQNIISFNPAKRIDELKKVKYKGAKYLTEAEIIEMLRCFKGDPLEMVILLTLFYGLRRSEILGLKWSAINFIKNVFEIRHVVVKVSKKTHYKNLTKNDSSNDFLPLTDIIKTHLVKLKEEQTQRKELQPNSYIDNDYICKRFDGELMSTDYVSKHFKLIMKKNNLPNIRFHDLRHSAGTYLKYLGFDLRDIQAWLRHADLKTTSQYTHVDLSAKVAIGEKLNAKLTENGFEAITVDKTVDIAQN
ncbi:MAG: site-specific integrase [Defluviitaleaceae bacterium]|nr:site-specific integrase [Defluviitaleaceae bacterium]MCL2247027.1 site-specific integrase [Lentimicrobiaceae bacterium]